MYLELPLALPDPSTHADTLSKLEMLIRMDEITLSSDDDASFEALMLKYISHEGPLKDFAFSKEDATELERLWSAYASDRQFIDQT